MKPEDFSRMITDAYQVGFAEAVRMYEPVQDLVRAKDAKRWLRMMNASDKVLREVSPKRVGEAKNSPLYYSKAEIKKAFGAMTTHAAWLNESVLPPPLCSQGRKIPARRRMPHQKETAALDMMENPARRNS